VLQRAGEHADSYLDIFSQLFLGPAFDAVLQSRLHLPAVIEILAAYASEQARQIAVQLLRQYDAVMVLSDSAEDQEALRLLMPDETVRLMQRLDARRAQLRQLIG
jgi:hypothetical protein